MWLEKGDRFHETLSVSLSVKDERHHPWSHPLCFVQEQRWGSRSPGVGGDTPSQMAQMYQHILRCGPQRGCRRLGLFWGSALEVNRVLDSRAHRCGVLSVKAMALTLVT